VEGGQPAERESQRSKVEAGVCSKRSTPWTTARAVATPGLAVACLWTSSTPAALNAGLPPTPDSVDRHTPLSTVQGFLRAAHDEDYSLAAYYLWLNHIPNPDQPRQGARLARRLRFVIDRKLFLDLPKISDDPEGDSTSNPKRVQLGSPALAVGRQGPRSQSHRCFRSNRHAANSTECERSLSELGPSLSGARANAGFCAKASTVASDFASETRPSNSHLEGVSPTAPPAAEVKRRDLT